MEHIFIDPVYAALFGWLAFNVIMFQMEKDKDDEKGLDFRLLEYIKRTWDNWLASLVCVPVALFIGFHSLDIGVIDMEAPKATYLYYLASGFIPELVIVKLKAWRNKQ